MSATKRLPFTEPQQRRPRIRRNGGSWNPLVALADIHAGNRSTDRRGVYDLFDAPVGGALRVEHADRSEPLLEAEPPWEAGGSMGPLFIWETDDGFHMIYETKSGTGYATSDDAYNWKRPDLGEVEIEGSTANNILKHGIIGSTGVFIDPHAPPAERFKAIGGDMAWYDPVTCEPLEEDEALKRYDAQEYGGAGYDGPRAEIWGRMLGWTSPDGRRWLPRRRFLKGLAAPASSRKGRAGPSHFRVRKISAVGRRPKRYWHPMPRTLWTSISMAPTISLIRTAPTSTP